MSKHAGKIVRKDFYGLWGEVEFDDLENIHWDSSHWHGNLLPKVGMKVEVTFDGKGELEKVVAIPPKLESESHVNLLPVDTWVEILLFEHWGKIQELQKEGYKFFRFSPWSGADAFRKFVEDSGARIFFEVEGTFIVYSDYEKFCRAFEQQEIYV